MLTWRNQNKLSYRYIHNINSVNDKISNSKEEKTSISMSIARMDGGITESHGETRLQHLHLQLRSGRLRNCKRVGVRGNLHLRNDGDFGFLEIPENRRVCRQDTQTLRKQRSTACSQARNAHHALGSSHGLQCHLCADEKNLSSGVAHVSPAFHHEHFISLIHSSFFHNTRTRSTIGTTRSTPTTPSASSTSPRNPGRKASLSRRTTLQWKSAEYLRTKLRALSWTVLIHASFSVDFGWTFLVKLQPSLWRLTQRIASQQPEQFTYLKKKDTFHMISMLRKEACSGSVNGLVYRVQNICIQQRMMFSSWKLWRFLSHQLRKKDHTMWCLWEINIVMNQMSWHVWARRSRC